MRPTRPYKDYKATKGLERPGGGQIERYLRVLHEALKGFIRAIRAIKAYFQDYLRGNSKEFGGAIKALI